MSGNVTAPRRVGIREHAEFDGAGWGEVVRRLRAASRHLTPTEQHFLSDVEAGKYKSLFTAASRLVDLFARVESDDEAYALCEVWESQIAARRAKVRAQRVLAIDELIRAEDAGEFTGNVAVREYTLNPDTVRARIAAEQLYAHEQRIKRLRAALAAVSGGSFR